MADSILNPTWRNSADEPKMDRRSRKTRAALVDALMDLLKEKPLKNISVTELARRADVNRATFYIHYRDVYDMYDKVGNELCTICTDLIDAHAQEMAQFNYEGVLHDLFSYFKDNAEGLMVFLRDNNALYSNVITAMHRRATAIAQPVEHVISNDRRLERAVSEHAHLADQLCLYEFRFIAGGIINVLQNWVDNGCTEPIDVIVQATDAFINNSPIVALKKNLQTIADGERPTA